MTPEESLNLKKLISKAEDYQDNTEYIRKVKHSEKIRDDIRKLDIFMKNNKNLKKKQPDRFHSRAMTECSFLFTNYTDIFNKVLSEELNFTIMSKLLMILKLIEDDKVDQNEGSVMVGKLLKELYVDSALKRCENLDKKYEAVESESNTENDDNSHKITTEPKEISWSDWKKKQT
jgi:hypothetical protein